MQNQDHDAFTASKLLHELERTIERAESFTKQAAAPVQQHVFKRFPVLFILATTFGLTMVLLGAEQILLASWLGEHPKISFLLGILILTATGTIYKKLG